MKKGIKRQISKKGVVLVIMLLWYNGVCSQEHERSKKLRVKSFSFSAFPLELYNDEYGSEWLSFTGDVSFALKKNIFSLSVSDASRLNIFGPSNTYSQGSFMYGREIKRDKLSLELHTGFGIFLKRVQDRVLNSTLGIPLMLKIRHQIGERFSMGFRVLRNFNSINKITTLGVLFQWDSLNKK